MGQGRSTGPVEAAPAPVCRGVYFQRDAAGLSNLRLQLETLLAICKVYRRFLVLPPPQRIAHLAAAFHESLFWSLQRLASHVPVVLAVDAERPPDAHEVAADFESYRLWDLPEGAHWYFTSAATRIQHFEALPLRTEADRRTAAACVLDSFELHDCHHRAAERLLRRASLSKYAYVAVHLRRGDFRTFRPEGFRSAEDIVRSLEPHVRGRTVLVATDAGEDDVEVAKLRALERLPGSRATHFVASLHESGDEDDALARAAVELLVCRWGASFVGTPDSTFTNGVFAMRAKDRRAGAGAAALRDDAPRLLFERRPESVAGCRGRCWNRLTEFRALD